MQDRLTDLRKQPSVQNDSVIDVGEEIGGDSESFMPEFFEEVSQIKTLMSLIRRNIKSIQEAYNKQAWSVGEGPQKNDELEQLLDSTNSATLQIRNKLKSMKVENDKIAGENAQRRVRTNMHTILSKKFIALVQEYQTIQNSYKEKCRERVQRQAQIVRPGVSREEVDEMIVSGGDVFADKLLSDSKHMEAKNALANIQEQQRDLKNLEKSIHELHQVFVDMAAIVESTQDSMDSMESDVSDSASNTFKVSKNLADAEKYLMQRRRRAAILITSVSTIIILAAIITGIIIAAKLGAFSGI